MKIKLFARKFSALALAAALSSSCVISGVIVTADTMSELEAKQSKLEEELQNVEALLSEYEGKASEADKYLEEYDNKMKFQEEQVAVVEEQIKMYEEDLAELEKDIAAKEAELDEGIEQFRQRLRALYMAGNDSLASVIAGSSDFYDMLARMEFVERVSKHDNDLIDSLTTQIEELETAKAEHEEKLAALEAKKAEEEAYYEELRETYNGHAETKQMHENMIADYEARADEIAEEQQEIEEELQAEIRRLQEEAERKRKEEALNKVTYDGGKMMWPIASYTRISSYFGTRPDPFGKPTQEYHSGMDMAAPKGTKIYAAYDGEVAWSYYSSSAGNWVGIDHGDGIYTVYMHMSKRLVSEGQKVKKGDVMFVLEAMKMENEICASMDGVVSDVSVTKGAAVDSGAVLCILK